VVWYGFEDKIFSAEMRFSGLIVIILAEIQAAYFWVRHNSIIIKTRR